jgi:hypothetical protein
VDFKASSHSSEEPALSVRQIGRLHLIDTDLEIHQTYSPTIVSFAFQATRELNEQILKQALRDVIAQHKVLRSTFPVLNGAREIGVRDDPDFEVVTFTEVPASQAAPLIAAEAKRRFNLETGPVIRLVISRSPSAGESVFAILVDHLVIDLMGLSVLLGKISKAYRARLAGTKEYLNGESSDTTAFSFARRQRELVASAEGGRRISYWRQRDHLVPAPFSLHHSYDAGLQEVHEVSQVISADLHAELKKAARRLLCTEYTLYVAAVLDTMRLTLPAKFQGLLSPFANRSKVAELSSIGLFQDVAIIISEWPLHQAPPEELVRRAAAAISAAIGNHYPHRELFRKLYPENTVAHPGNSLPRTTSYLGLNYVGEVVKSYSDALDLPGVVQAIDLPFLGQASEPIYLEIWHTTDGATMTMRFNGLRGDQHALEFLDGLTFNLERFAAGQQGKTIPDLDHS